jgi:hypothetical protein
VKLLTYNKIKKQEGRTRMAAMRQSRRDPRSASVLQKHASLVGNGAKWRITNFSQVARAMAKWA